MLDRLTDKISNSSMICRMFDLQLVLALLSVFVSVPSQHQFYAFDILLKKMITVPLRLLVLLQYQLYHQCIYLYCYSTSSTISVFTCTAIVLALPLVYLLLLLQYQLYHQCIYLYCYSISSTISDLLVPLQHQLYHQCIYLYHYSTSSTISVSTCTAAVLALPLVYLLVPLQHQIYHQWIYLYCYSTSSTISISTCTATVLASPLALSLVYIYTCTATIPAS